MKPLWDVIGRRWIGYVLSALFIIPGVVALFVNSSGGHGALNWGVDFTGGTYFQVRLARQASVGDIRDVVDRFTAGQSVIQKSEEDVFIRTRPISPADKAGLIAALRESFGGVTVLREDVGARPLEEIGLMRAIADTTLAVVEMQGLLGTRHAA